MRLSALKALPTDEEIENYECKDACGYLAKLKRKSRTAFDALMIEGATPWGELPKQPMDRCVAHTINIMFTRIEAANPGEANMQLTPKEVKFWLSTLGAGAKK